MRANMILISFLVASCGESAGPPEADLLDAQHTTLTSLEKDVFGASCAISISCHRGTESASGLDLEAPVYARIVGKNSFQSPGSILVIPGDGPNSYLYQKISEDRPPSGERMPIRQILPKSSLDRVLIWIDRGAQDD
jgi:hypothetical protein